MQFEPRADKSKAGLFATRCTLYTETMSEMQMGPREEPNSTLRFMRNRKATASKEVEDGEVNLLNESNNLEHTFKTLWFERLKRRRHIYPTMKAFGSRDKAVAKNASETLPTESAQMRSILKRPDQGRPSQLEYWFHTLLSDKKWEDLCNEFEDRQEKADWVGGHGVRDAIEKVFSDEQRTRALIGAVDEQVRRMGRKQVTIYDIECGPFPVATIAAAIANPNADITCIESNPLSAAIARHILKSFDETGKTRKGKIE